MNGAIPPPPPEASGVSGGPVVLPADAVLPALPDTLPRRRYPIARPIGLFVMKLLGWRYTGGFNGASRQVMVGWPHTSNWDGIIGLAAGAVIGLSIRVFAKKALFTPPIGWILRSFGGIPVERQRPGGVVAAAVDLFKRKEASGEGLLFIVLPEGTRSRCEGWKTGFHRIAVQAGVPISVLVFDHGKKEVGIAATILPSGDLDADLNAIAKALKGVRGRHPEKQTPPIAASASGSAACLPQASQRETVQPVPAPQHVPPEA